MKNRNRRNSHFDTQSVFRFKIHKKIKQIRLMLTFTSALVCIEWRFVYKLIFLLINMNRMGEIHKNKSVYTPRISKFKNTQLEWRWCCTYHVSNLYGRMKKKSRVNKSKNNRACLFAAFVYSRSSLLILSLFFSGFG